MEGVLAIIGIFFVPVVMIILIVWFRSNERRNRYQLQAEVYAKAIEKGQSIPDDLFAELQKKRNPLQKGIILIATGIGVSLMFVLMAIPATRIDHEAFDGMMTAASLGVLPLIIGVAYVLIHFIEKKKDVGENAK